MGSEWTQIQGKSELKFTVSLKKGHLRVINSATTIVFYFYH